MERVLIPVDFTDSALNGAAYAVDLFRMADSAFTLTNAFLDAAIADPLMLSATPGLLETTRRQMKEFEGRLRAIAQVPMGSLSTDVRPGTLSLALSEQLAHPGYSFVVMGSRRRHTALFGSQVADAVMNVRAPLIVVPDGYRFDGLRHILLASDQGPMAPAAFNPLLRVAWSHGAHITILRVEERTAAGVALNPDPVYQAVFGGVAHGFHAVGDPDVTQAIEKQADRRRVDMVAVLHRRKGLIGELFDRSISKQLALHTQVPLLVLPLPHG